MPGGPLRFRLPEVARAIRAFRQATQIDAEDIRVDIHRDGSFSIYAKQIEVNHPQVGEPPLEAGKEIVL
jgi:hypothetical protein